MINTDNAAANDARVQRDIAEEAAQVSVDATKNAFSDEKAVVADDFRSNAAEVKNEAENLGDYVKTKITADETKMENKAYEAGKHVETTKEKLVDRLRDLSAKAMEATSHGAEYVADKAHHFAEKLNH